MYVAFGRRGVRAVVNDPVLLSVSAFNKSGVRRFTISRLRVSYFFRE